MAESLFYVHCHTLGSCLDFGCVKKKQKHFIFLLLHELTGFSLIIIFMAHIYYNEEVTVVGCRCINPFPKLSVALWRKRELLNKREGSSQGLEQECSLGENCEYLEAVVPAQGSLGEKGLIMG